MQRDGVVSSYFGLFFHLSDLVEVEPQEQEQEMRLWKSRPHDVTIISCLLLTRQLNPQHHPLALYIEKELLLLASLNTKNEKNTSVPSDQLKALASPQPPFVALYFSKNYPPKWSNIK